jgi:hypothetical protein
MILEILLANVEKHIIRRRSESPIRNKRREIAVMIRREYVTLRTMREPERNCVLVAVIILPIDFLMILVHLHHTHSIIGTNPSLGVILLWVCYVARRVLMIDGHALSLSFKSKMVR